MIILVMGVSGSGKTTVGVKLAERLGYEFYDADDFHPLENVEKMRNGIPLDDDDRKPWLEILAALMRVKSVENKDLVLACSALKQKYRDILQVSENVKFIYLKGDSDLIAERLVKRIGHYMNPQLLQSQFEALEEPKNTLTIEIDAEPDLIVEKILKEL